MHGLHEMRGLEVVVAAATAFQALTSELQEAVAMLQPSSDSSPAADLRPPARLLRMIRRFNMVCSQLIAYAGAQSLESTKLELLPFLSDLAYTLRAVLDKRIDVVVDVGHDCPPCHADPAGLREALTNLVVNSRDAMPHGGTIQLSAKVVEAADGHSAVAVAVKDNGVGMVPEFLSLAMRPFVTTKPNSPYAGLGLPAADGFARQSGGRLELVSRPGGGVTATVFLPRHFGN